MAQFLPIVHFQSNHFKEEDYEFLENPDSGSNEHILNGVHNIIARLKRASIRRSLQVDELCADLQLCKYPYIVCGDFNDPPFSYTYESTIVIIVIIVMITIPVIISIIT